MSFERDRLYRSRKGQDIFLPPTQGAPFLPPLILLSNRIKQPLEERADNGGVDDLGFGLII